MKVLVCWRNGVIYSHKKSINTSFLDWITFLINSCNLMLKFSVDTSCFHNELIFNILLVKCICLFNDPNWGLKRDLKVWWGYEGNGSVPTWTIHTIFSKNFFNFFLYWKEKKEKSGQLFNNQPLSSWEVHSFFH